MCTTFNKLKATPLEIYRKLSMINDNINYST